MFQYLEDAVPELHTGTLATSPESHTAPPSPAPMEIPTPRTPQRRCRHRGHTHQRPRGPRRPAQEYKETNEYRHKTPRATDTTLSRERRGAVVTCFVCLQRILGTNTSSHLSSAHGFTRQLTRYLLDIERIRRQQGPDILNVKDCITCLRRFVACSSHCHQLPECVLVDVPNYMEPDSLCEEAKIIKALCGGGQPTPRSCRVTLRAAYEKLKELFKGE